MQSGLSAAMSLLGVIEPAPPFSSSGSGFAPLLSFSTYSSLVPRARSRAMLLLLLLLTPLLLSAPLVEAQKANSWEVVGTSGASSRLSSSLMHAEQY